MTRYGFISTPLILTPLRISGFGKLQDLMCSYVDIAGHDCQDTTKLLAIEVFQVMTAGTDMVLRSFMFDLTIFLTSTMSLSVVRPKKRLQSHHFATVPWFS